MDGFRFGVSLCEKKKKTNGCVCETRSDNNSIN